jgi:phosphoribosylformimino-5-aminoimidazole carboxamide ribonucleotide (ProFAR) isomerase
VILYPAIDIRGGQAVRLLQGDYERETAYDSDPVDAARRWAEEGAEFLHVVDLDGARAGEPQNLEAVRRIATAVACPIQVGGGLRDPQFLDAVLAAHGESVVVSIDTRGGKVSLAGWTETSDVDAPTAVADLSERGVRRFLCTAIEVDGTMEGPAVRQLNEIAAATPAQVIASGGVGELAHLEELAFETAPNVEGAIVGRALYERRFTVAEGIAALT